MKDITVSHSGNIYGTGLEALVSQGKCGGITASHTISIGEKVLGDITVSCRASIINYEKVGDITVSSGNIQFNVHM